MNPAGGCGRSRMPGRGRRARVGARERPRVVRDPPSRTEVTLRVGDIMSGGPTVIGERSCHVRQRPVVEEERLPGLHTPAVAAGRDDQGPDPRARHALPGRR